MSEKVIKGAVIPGNRVGRSLGYPTANISVDGRTDIPDGVYAARVEITDGIEGTDGGRCYGAMANLGVKPTFLRQDTAPDSGAGSPGANGDPARIKERLLEVHLLGFEGDLYGKELTVRLETFIRPERKFSSSDELRAQIEKDEELIKTILKCT